MTDYGIKNVFSHRCRHTNFIVDQKLGYVECGKCGEKLNPMWVLEQFCYDESYVRNNLDSLRASVKAMEKRVRTKCQHCGKMTRVRGC